MPTEHLVGEQPLPGKCETGDYQLVETRKVRYSDIDLNGHLNNTKYIDYIVDIHDSDFYKKGLQKMKRVLNNYHNVYQELQKKEDRFYGNKLQFCMNKHY